MAKIYTKYGDTGITYTKSNPKMPKNDLLIHLLGEIDELNSCIGYLSSIMPRKDLLFITEIDSFLHEIMSVLFSIGAFIGYDTDINMNSLDQFVEKIEGKIDWFETYNEKLESFILPTGTSCSAYSHVCRTVCRRVERRLYDIPKAGNNAIVVRFFNRLSDYLFSVSRACNSIGGGKETIWKNCL